MKKRFLLLFLLTAFFVNAQTIVTTTAGNLQTDMAGQTGVTHLVINGTLNAGDFRFMKTTYSLVTVDLSGVTAIEAYSGQLGPEPTVTEYPANEFPERGLYQEPTLTTVLLPTNGAITSTGKLAFGNDTSLTTFNIPASVTLIRENAFSGCTSLTGTLTIPNTVTTMEKSVFSGTLYSTIILPAGLTEISASLVASNPNLTTMAIRRL